LRSYKEFTLLQVNKNILLLIAGAVWLLVGLMLLMMAFFWLLHGSHVHDLMVIMTGIVAALVIYRCGFLKIVRKNVLRILPMTDKMPIVSFIPWRSYVTIAIMITLGAFLRHSAIPKQYLAVVYIGIGLALTLSSLGYFGVYLEEIRKGS
jgi:hypothetical protein